MPFYVNMPEVAVAISLADPKISPMIRRYPEYIAEDEPIW
jgi:hypothetical protein